MADVCRVYEWLPRDRRIVGMGGAANRNEGLHSKLRSKLNRLARRPKGYIKSVDMLKDPLAIALEDCLNQSLKIHYAAGCEYRPYSPANSARHTSPPPIMYCPVRTRSTA